MRDSSESEIKTPFFFTRSFLDYVFFFFTTSFLTTKCTSHNTIMMNYYQKFVSNKCEHTYKQTHAIISITQKGTHPHMHTLSPHPFSLVELG